MIIMIKIITEAIWRKLLNLPVLTDVGGKCRYRLLVTQPTNMEMCN